jgi:hypothetical protein
LSRHLGLSGRKSGLPRWLRLCKAQVPWQATSKLSVQIQSVAPRLEVHDVAVNQNSAFKVHALLGRLVLQAPTLERMDSGYHIEARRASR